MHSMFQRSIQIAGVKDLAEAQLLESLGVDFIGFPLRLGYHKPDSHTGVEGPSGEKSSELVRCFLNEARRAFKTTPERPS